MCIRDRPILDIKTNTSFIGKSDLEIVFPDEYSEKEIWLLIWDEILFKWYTNSNSIFVLKDKALVKVVSKRWFVLVDLQNL